MDDLALLVPPSEFHKLAGITIEQSHLFIFICHGKLEMTINGKKYVMSELTLVDLFETFSIKIGHVDAGLQAWCFFTTFEFASNSLRNLRPGPDPKPHERQNVPINSFTSEESSRIVHQLQLLKETLTNTSHYYRKELAELYFKSFSLELGNALLAKQKVNEKVPKYISRRDFITLNFIKLVTQHYAKEHRADFYAHQLCISTKHLTRVIKEMTGKTPHAIINSEIIHHAMHLLEDDKIPVSRIAEELYFSDQASFCKFFKKQKSISPMGYRRRIK